MVHYKAQGTAHALFCYVHVNLQEKTVAEPISLKTPLEDISKDCKLGIDAKLNIYDLAKGQVTKRIPYVNRGLKMRLHVRFTYDCKHVVFVDRMDDTLHVVHMNQDNFRTIASCFTHAPKMNFFGGLTLRQKGHVIVITSSEGEAIIVLRLLDTQKKEMVQYGSETERALSLVPDSKWISLNLSTASNYLPTLT